MPTDRPIYMDYAASTPCDGRVLEAMLPFLTSCHGNPSNRNHRYGWEAAQAVDHARVQVARLLGANPGEIIFTSGATESDNFAVKGITSGLGKPTGSPSRGHIITSALEHKAVLLPAQLLAEQGFDVTFLKPAKDGVTTADMVASALRDDTIFVSVMWANNETGVINEVPKIGALCRKAGVCFHTDATQWVGKMPVDLRKDAIDLLSLSAHKIYGPKGVGALYVRQCERTSSLRAQIDGGGQEQGLRAGTLNVPGIVGLGAACEICRHEMDDEAPRLAGLRDRLETGLLEKLDRVRINGQPDRRLPHITSMSFESMDGEALMMVAADIACSAASACSSMQLSPSHVLTAMGLPDELALATLRFSLGRATAEADVDHAISQIAAAVNNLRSLAPMLGLG
jgi:cysteine desulfurase